MFNKFTKSTQTRNDFELMFQVIRIRRRTDNTMTMTMTKRKRTKGQTMVTTQTTKDCATGITQNKNGER